MKLDDWINPKHPRWRETFGGSFDVYHDGSYAYTPRTIWSLIRWQWVIRFGQRSFW